MRILIINPNSDERMAEKIQGCARDFAQGDYQVDCVCAKGGPPFIETYGDMQQAAPGMMEALSQNLEAYDAFVVACGYDPNLDLMKEMTTKPMVGMGEASLKLASMLGHRFTILSTDRHSVPIKEDLAAKYGMKPYLASVRVIPLWNGEAPPKTSAQIQEVSEIQAQGPEASGEASRLQRPEAADGEAPPKTSAQIQEVSEIQAQEPEASYAAACRQAVEQDGAEVIVLGCAGLSGLDKKLEQMMGIPVLDGVKCALLVAAGLVKCKVSISKIRKYSLYYETQK